MLKDVVQLKPLLDVGYPADLENFHLNCSLTMPLPIITAFSSGNSG